LRTSQALISGSRHHGSWDLVRLSGLDENGPATIRDAIPGARPIGKPADETLLAEILALRTILLNLFYDLANGEPMTTERMKELIAKADGEKRENASARLKSHPIQASEGVA